jgi:hypothetical protein
MNPFIVSNYVSDTVALKFQGSDTGIKYTDIITVGKEIHEGWNYYPYPADKKEFRYYRFYGNGPGSCNIGEVGFRGVEVIDDPKTSHVCTASLTIDKIPKELSGVVTYTSSMTSLLTSITPRYGKVQGGEEITFNGKYFNDIPSAYSIIIDGIPCIVSAASTT